MAPIFSASRHRSGTTSKPKTRAPEATRSCYHKLAHQPEADHASDVAELHLRLAHTLKRDGADRAESGELRRHAVRHRDAEIHRNPVQLGMKGELVTSAGDDLSD